MRLAIIALYCRVPSRRCPSAKLTSGGSPTAAWLARRRSWPAAAPAPPPLLARRRSWPTAAPGPPPPLKAQPWQATRRCSSLAAPGLEREREREPMKREKASPAPRRRAQTATGATRHFSFSKTTMITEYGERRSARNGTVRPRTLPPTRSNGTGPSRARNGTVRHGLLPTRSRGTRTGAERHYPGPGPADRRNRVATSKPRLTAYAAIHPLTAPKRSAVMLEDASVLRRGPSTEGYGARRRARRHWRERRPGGG
jgi:hypothetical protein